MFLLSLKQSEAPRYLLSFQYLPWLCRGFSLAPGGTDGFIRKPVDDFPAAFSRTVEIEKDDHAHTLFLEELHLRRNPRVPSGMPPDNLIAITHYRKPTQPPSVMLPGEHALNRFSF